MPVRTLAPVLIVAALAAGPAACTSRQKPVSVTLDNESAAQLEVEVDLPARGPLGRKPSHEAFRTLLPAGKRWENGPDTLRFASDPNTDTGFRVWVADVSGDRKIWFNPFTVTGSRKNLHVVFRGNPGSLVWLLPGGAETPLEVHQASAE